jgi:peptidoglycan/xylan/chitin deacetylase (PgdA/CDA1 family)
LKTVILCYHKIGFEPEEGRFLNCSPSQLTSHAHYFQRKAWSSFLPRDLICQKKAGICFTFDDSYVSAVQNAPSILEQFGFCGAFYVVPSLVGQNSAWDGDQACPLATWDQLLSLVARGHELGNHTQHHPHLNQLSLQEQMTELKEASRGMHEHGIEPASIAFPYGHYNDSTFSAMESCGIKVGLALGKRPVSSEPIHCLPRIVVGYSDSVVKLLYKIYVRPKLP